MIKSMTGYGRANAVIGGMDITVELRAVNHRYFEFSARVPRQYIFIEDKLKSLVQSKLTRGKIDCFLTIEMLETSSSEVIVNQPLAAAYVDALKQLTAEFNLPEGVTAAVIARYPDVLTVRKASEDEEAFWSAVGQIAGEALTNLITMREKEGISLKNDIDSRIETIINSIAFIEEQSPQTLRDYVEKMKQRINDLIGDVSVDEQRILTEAAIFADKIAVAEEVVRLRSHLKQTGEMLRLSEAVGRKLDFLVQEINREANTIGSKAQDVKIVKEVINIKSEVEKIREQVQNIE